LRNSLLKYILHKPVLFIFPLLLNLSDIQNGFSQAPLYSNEFLNIGIDAASFSKGNAVIASSLGVCSGYWNPAGITSMETRFETSLMHANYFSGLAQYDYFGFAFKPTDSLGLGLSLIRFGIDDIPNTLDLIDENGNVNYDRITYFSVSDYALLLSVARITKVKGLKIGANLKLVYRRQGNFANAYGFGFDIGGQYQLKNWRFGAVLRDASSTFNFWVFNKDLFSSIYLQTGNEIPENSLEITMPKLLFGVAYEHQFNKKISLLAEIDVDWYFNAKQNSLISGNLLNFDPHAGVQFSYLKNIHIRAGVDKFQLIEDFDKSDKLMFQTSVGAGFYFYHFSLDYALSNVGDFSVAPLSHIFSLKYSFNIKKQ